MDVFRFKDGFFRLQNILGLDFKFSTAPKSKEGYKEQFKTAESA